MKVALDTNVLISAFVARGLSSDVFRYILADHELVLSEKVLSEFARIMHGKFGVPKKFVSEFEHELRQHHVEPFPAEEPAFKLVRDPDDRVVLRSSIRGGAAVLVTGDRDLLDVAAKITQIQILTPRQFWESVREGK